MSCCDFTINDKLRLKENFKEDYAGSNPDGVGVITKIRLMTASSNSFTDSDLGQHWIYVEWKIGRFVTTNAVPCNTVELMEERVNATNFTID